MARRYTVLLVVLFVVLDAAAVLFLRYRMSVPPDPPPEFATPQAAADPGGDDANPIAGLLFLAGAADGHVLRMTRGSCDEEQPLSAIAWVAPPGADAAEVAPPGGLVQTLGIGYDDDADRWWVVGTDAECTVAQWTGGLAGTSWEQVDGPIEAWYVDPADDTRLATPQGPLSLGSDCHATSAQVAGPYAYAVCDDGRVLETLRRAREFVSLDIGAEVVALAVRDDERTAALTTDSDCLAGLLLLRSPGGPKTSDQCFANNKVGLGVTWAGDDLVAQVGFDLLTNDNGDWVPRG